MPQWIFRLTLVGLLALSLARAEAPMAFVRQRGPLTLSDRPYMAVRTFEKGMEDLRKFANDPKTTFEGCFFFDHDKKHWYSFGGHTHLNVEGGMHLVYVPKVAYAKFMRAFPGHLTHVHMHPRGLLNQTRLENHPEFTEDWNVPFLKLFGIVMPSTPDAEMYFNIYERLSPTASIDFQIVSPYGVTTVALGTLGAMHLSQYAENVRHTLIEHMLGWPNLAEFSERELINFFVQRMNRYFGPPRLAFRFIHQGCENFLKPGQP